MTVIVFGASGILGSELCNILEKHNISYIGTCHLHQKKNFKQINFNNFQEIKELFDINKPTVCINCIAKRFIDECENNWNSTQYTNIYITTKIATLCSLYNCYLIHISTDYVFDGRAPPYSPNSHPNPLQNYGISKFIAEQRILTYSSNYSIIRVPVLYNINLSKFQDSAITLISKKILNQINLTTEDNYSIRRPLYIPDLCNFILDLIKSPKQGLFHFYNPNDKITKYELLKYMARYLNKKHSHVTPIIENTNLDSNRPFDTQLIDNQYDINEYKFHSIFDRVKDLLSQVYHPSLSLLPQDIFILLDLDGTLIDSEKIHLECYNKALLPYNIQLTNTEFNHIIQYDNISNYLQNIKKLSYSEVNEIRINKNNYIKYYSNLQLMPGAKELIECIFNNHINHVVVTNTTRSTVNHFISICPELKKLNNWITREDYNKSKPEPDSYQTAFLKFYKKENYIIGVENSINGLNALKHVTKCIYFMTEKDKEEYINVQNEDVYIINNLKTILE